jgi:hypothetical protein
MYLCVSVRYTYTSDSPFIHQQFQHTEKSLFIIPLVWGQGVENQNSSKMKETGSLSLSLSNTHTHTHTHTHTK